MDAIGKYEILEKIGVGGFGVVYKGRDPFIKRLVAVKTCSSEDEEIRRRFFREAEIAGNLHHRNVTTVYDFGVHDEVPYLVQEFLTGEDLKQFIRTGQPLLDHMKVDFLLQIAEGLEYAHDQGVVHRDIKPGNIRILESGRVKIMDFGIAKLTHAESQLTKTGMTLGTSAYLAPEQIQGDDITKAVDIYAYGVVAYELLTGRRPFRGDTVSSLFYQILNHEPTPVGEIWTRCPPELASMIERCLEKEAQDRYWSFSEVIEHLRPIRDRLAAASDDSSAQPTQRLDLTETSHPTVAMPSREIREALDDLRNRVETALEAGDPTAAEVELALARKRHPPRGDVDSEITSLEDRIRRERRSRDQERRETERLDVLLERSRELASVGEPEEAILVLETARDLHPDDERIRRALDSLETDGTVPSISTAEEPGPRRRLWSRPLPWVAVGLLLVGTLAGLHLLSSPEATDRTPETEGISAGEEPGTPDLPEESRTAARQELGPATVDDSRESDPSGDRAGTTPASPTPDTPSEDRVASRESSDEISTEGSPAPPEPVLEEETDRPTASPPTAATPVPEAERARRELARGNDDRALDLALAALGRDPGNDTALEVVNELVDRAAATSGAAAREARSADAADLAPSTYREAAARRQAAEDAADSGRPERALSAYTESASLFRRASGEARAERQERERQAEERRRAEAARAEEDRTAAEEASAPEPPPSEPSTSDPREEVTRVLRRYEAGYEALDFQAVRSVYPSVPERLAGAFEDFQSLELTLSDCVIEPEGDRARARCRMSQVARFEGGDSHQEQRTVEFLLERQDGRWLIVDRSFS